MGTKEAWLARVMVDRVVERDGRGELQRKRLRIRIRWAWTYHCSYSFSRILPIPSSFHSYTPRTNASPNLVGSCSARIRTLSKVSKDPDVGSI